MVGRNRKSTSAQGDRFKIAARELGSDESEEHFDAALAKVARHKPPLSDKPSNVRKTASGGTKAARD